MSTRRVLWGEHATAMSPGMITLVAGRPYQIGGGVGGLDRMGVTVWQVCREGCQQCVCAR
ncbi:hypothetical protein [Rhodococcus sp. Q]|uniref:hypothetical protein n=1 Tax=Rhodococcus sp. Q TaxID=2502252 RepID=UPI0010F63C49|nr:hypothetical protein [Rhodococcus sp. Q]